MGWIGFLLEGLTVTYLKSGTLMKKDCFLIQKVIK